MTDRPEQIKNIIEGLTNYSGNYFSIVTGISKVDEALPKFYVKQIYNKNNNDNVQQSQFFRIELEADSTSNLLTQIKAILALQTNSTAGYNRAITPLWHKGVLFAFTDDISRKNDDSDPLTGDTGRLSNDEYVLFLRFRMPPQIIQGITLLDARLKLTPKNTVAEDTPKWNIGNQIGVVLDPTTSTNTQWILKIGSGIIDPPLGANWTKDIVAIIAQGDFAHIVDILQEAVNDANYDGNLGIRISSLDPIGQFDFYAKDIGDSNPTKVPLLELNTIAVDEEYPYWIKMDLIDDKPSANKFKALIECEARWTI